MFFSRISLCMTLFIYNWSNLTFFTLLIYNLFECGTTFKIMTFADEKPTCKRSDAIPVDAQGVAHATLSDPWLKLLG